MTTAGDPPLQHVVCSSLLSAVRPTAGRMAP